MGLEVHHFPFTGGCGIFSRRPWRVFIGIAILDNFPFAASPYKKVRFMGRRKRNQRVLVSMSGGLDSTMAAVLLKEDGWEVIGAHMQLYDVDRVRPSGCCSPKDAEDAGTMARLMGIPFHIFDFRDAFTREVIVPFVESYRCGRTPNPCVLCNDRMKFRLLRSRALELGAPYIATGHYARIGHCPDRGRHLLLKGVDRRKDQSYFLFTLTQDQAGSTLFPLGGRTKEGVRAKARQMGLPVWEKDESQEICFIPDADYRIFVDDMAGGSARPGQIVDLEGNVLGCHQGISRFTVGQRRGLGIASNEPYYVVRLEEDSNRVVVGCRGNLSHSGLLASGVNWIAGSPPEVSEKVMVKIRYRSKEISAILESVNGCATRVRFVKPAGAVTPGQAAVFYRGDEVLGGGWIEQGL